MTTRTTATTLTPSNRRQSNQTKSNMKNQNGNSRERASRSKTTNAMTTCATTHILLQQHRGGVLFVLILACLSIIVAIIYKRYTNNSLIDDDVLM